MALTTTKRRELSEKATEASGLAQLGATGILLSGSEVWAGTKLTQARILLDAVLTELAAAGSP